jgi:hypothetical protein
MNATYEHNIEDFTFSKPAVYQIKVQGELDRRWSSRLGDMQIKVIKSQGSKTVSELVGSVTDQAALSGILNSLNDLRLVILSVKILKELNR